MGRIKKGILGGFSGKVGSVVGASWRGLDYMRGLPRKSTKAATVPQLAQQNKMALFRGFLLGVDDIVERCFQNIGNDPIENHFCKLKKAGLRADKMARIILPKSAKGHSVNCYISFYSENRNLASTNEYLGEVVVL